MERRDVRVARVERKVFVLDFRGGGVESCRMMSGLGRGLEGEESILEREWGLFFLVGED